MDVLKTQTRQQPREGDRVYALLKHQGTDCRGNPKERFISTQNVPVAELATAIENALGAVTQSDEVFDLRQTPYFMLEPAPNKLYKSKRLGVEDLVSFASVTNPSLLEAENCRPTIHGELQTNVLHGKCMATALVTAKMRVCNEAGDKQVVTKNTAPTFAESRCSIRTASLSASMTVFLRFLLGLAASSTVLQP